MNTEDVKNSIKGVDIEKLEQASRLLKKSIFTDRTEIDYSDPTMTEAFYVLHLINNLIAISKQSSGHL